MNGLEPSVWNMLIKCVSTIIIVLILTIGGYYTVTTYTAMTNGYTKGVVLTGGTVEWIKP